MKDFLNSEKEAHKKRWSSFLSETTNTLNEIRAETDINFELEVHYLADSWLKGHEHKAMISYKDKKKVVEEVYFNVIKYNLEYDEDIAVDKGVETIRKALLDKGVLTPIWFSILTLCRNYDCVLTFKKDGNVEIDETSTYFEEKINSKHW